MLRKTRQIIGNTQSLHKTLRKLQDGQCLHIYIFGGSVTAGHNAGGKNSAYPRWLRDVLDAKYPCKDAKTGNGGTHQIINPDFSGLTSAALLQNIYAVFPPNRKLSHRIDLLIIEFNVNDNFLSAPPQIKDTSEGAIKRLYAADFPRGSPEEFGYFLTVQWWTEAVIRLFLQLPLSIYAENDPEHHIGSIPIINFVADFQNFYGFLNGHGYPMRTYGSGTQFISSTMWRYYEITTISAAEPLFNLYQSQYAHMENWNGSMLMGNIVNNDVSQNTMYTLSNMHADRCCHPLAPGHRFLAMVLLYNLEKEMKFVKHVDAAQLRSLQQHTDDFAEHHVIGNVERYRELFLPPPWRLNALEDRMLCQPHGVLTYVDFMLEKPQNLQDIVAENDGDLWSFYADSKNKTGFISTTPKSHVSFVIDIQSMRNVLRVGYLMTYDLNNTATVLLWCDYNKHNVYKESYCNHKDTDYNKDGHRKTDAVVTDPATNTPLYVIDSRGGGASVYADRTFLNVLPDLKDEAKYLHFCVLQKQEQHQKYKFKLLTFSSNVLT